MGRLVKKKRPFLKTITDRVAKHTEAHIDLSGILVMNFDENVRMKIASVRIAQLSFFLLGIGAVILFSMTLCGVLVECPPVEFMFVGFPGWLGYFFRGLVFAIVLGVFGFVFSCVGIYMDKNKWTKAAFTIHALLMAPLAFLFLICLFHQSR